MTDLSKAKWHQYGVVEVAFVISEDTKFPWDMTEYVKYVAPVSRPTRPAEYDTRVFRHVLDVEPPQETGEHWVDVANGETLAGDDYESTYVPLFQAASQLAWHDFSLFQEADRAMGDPYP